MTTPSVPAAPLPTATVPNPAVGQSLDLTPATAAENSALKAAAAESAVRWTGKLNVGGKREYDLVPTLSPIDMIMLQEAQESGSLRQIVETTPLLVLPEQQAEMKEWLLSSPANVEDRIDLADVIAALNNGIEQINARP